MLPACCKSLPFLILLGLGLVNFIAGARLSNREFGTEVHPVTVLMIEAMRGSYQFLLVLIVAYYAGEVIWRERDARIAEATDATPCRAGCRCSRRPARCSPSCWRSWQSACWRESSISCRWATRTSSSGSTFKPCCSDSMPFLLMAIAAVFLQVISNQKFIGYALFILVFVLQTVLVSVHLEHNLYTYAGSPALTYSDMNGYGHSCWPWAWFNVYWTVFAAMLLVIAAAFWVRGTAPSWRGRWNHAMRALRGRQGALLGALAVAFVAIGSWIFYNTNVVNEYLPSDVVLDRQAHYEKEYRKYKDLPQPRITDVLCGRRHLSRRAARRDPRPLSAREQDTLSRFATCTSR